jgi:FlaA1/EpsC-like NDP-sugar epimerase
VQRLERAMSSVYSVIHAAALKRIEVGAYNPDEMTKTNILGTLNVIDAARRAEIGKVVLVSSDKAYQPVSPYGNSKAMAESLILNSNDPQYGPRFGVVRYGNVAGSTGSVIPTWRAAMERGDRVRLTSPDCTRFWMSVEEAAKLVVDTLVSMQGGELVIPDLPAFKLGDLAMAMGIPATRSSASARTRRCTSRWTRRAARRRRNASRWRTCAKGCGRCEPAQHHARIRARRSASTPARRTRSRLRPARWR